MYLSNTKTSYKVQYLPFVDDVELCNSDVIRFAGSGQWWAKLKKLRGFSIAKINSR